MSFDDRRPTAVDHQLTCYDVAMQQGYSGSTVRRVGDWVEKESADAAFVESPARQRDLIALSARLACLPQVHSMTDGVMSMDFVDGAEGVTLDNAHRAGAALRTLHDALPYPHVCATGIGWLVDMANANLAAAHRTQRVAATVETLFPDDALIHSEPVQFVERADGGIVFIDIESIGSGSRYRDLGFVAYVAALRGLPDLAARFISGYGALSDGDASRKINSAAGLTALAYAGFADTEARLALGLALLAGELG